MQVNIYEAKTRLSELLEQAQAGKMEIDTEAGTPMAKRVPLEAGPKRKIKFGLLKGQFVESADLDAPLPEEEFVLWEGRGEA